MKIKIIFTLLILLYFSTNLFSYDYQKLLDITKKDLKEIEVEVKKLERKIKTNKNNAEMNAELGFYFYTMALYEKLTAAKAVKYFEKSYELEKDILIKGIIGLSYVLRAQEEANLGYLDKGFKILDEACDECNENVYVKSILLSYRISYNLDIPEFVYPRRIEIIKKDIAEMEKLNKEGKLSDIDYVYILYDKIRFLKKERSENEAEDVINIILINYPDHPVTLKIKEEFNK